MPMETIFLYSDDVDGFGGFSGFGNLFIHYSGLNFIQALLASSQSHSTRHFSTDQRRLPPVNIPDSDFASIQTKSPTSSVYHYADRGWVSSGERPILFLFFHPAVGESGFLQ